MFLKLNGFSILWMWIITNIAQSKPIGICKTYFSIIGLEGEAINGRDLCSRTEVPFVYFVLKCSDSNSLKCAKRLQWSALSVCDKVNVHHEEIPITTAINTVDNSELAMELSLYIQFEDEVNEVDEFSIHIQVDPNDENIKTYVNTIGKLHGTKLEVEFHRVCSLPDYLKNPFQVISYLLNNHPSNRRKRQANVDYANPSLPKFKPDVSAFNEAHSYRDLYPIAQNDRVISIGDEKYFNKPPVRLSRGFRTPTTTESYYQKFWSKVAERQSKVDSNKSTTAGLVQLANRNPYITTTRSPIDNENSNPNQKFDLSDISDGKSVISVLRGLANSDVNNSEDVSKKPPPQIHTSVTSIPVTTTKPVPNTPRSDYSSTSTQETSILSTIGSTPTFTPMITTIITGSQAFTTSALRHVVTTSALPHVVTTSALPHVVTTSALPHVITTSALPHVVTSALPHVVTTSALSTTIQNTTVPPKTSLAHSKRSSPAAITKQHTITSTSPPAISTTTLTPETKTKAANQAPKSTAIAKQLTTKPTIATTTETPTTTQTTTTSIPRTTPTTPTNTTPITQAKQTLPTTTSEDVTLTKTTNKSVVETTTAMPVVSNKTETSTSTEPGLNTPLPSGETGTAASSSSRMEGKHDDPIQGSDNFWPIVAAMVIGIPSVIVFGIAITVIHKKRTMAKPQRKVYIKNLGNRSSISV